MTILTTIYVVVAVLALFGAAIFIHEFGHYWVARKLGMKVEEFAVGFGPKIYSWKRDGIVYSLRWIPAGGFVKLPQMVTSEALEGQTTEAVPPAPPSHKILTAFAGPFMNVVLAFGIATIIYFVGLPVPVNPPIIGYIEPGSAEAKLGIQEGDVIKAVNGQKVESWQDIMLDTAVAQKSVMPVVIEHAGKEHTYQLKATMDSSIGLKMLNLDPRDHPQIYQVVQGSPAEKAGLRAKDIVLSFAGFPVASGEQMVQLIRKCGGQGTEMRVKRGQKELTLKITPIVEPGTHYGHIGVLFGPSTTQVYVVEKPGPTPWENVGRVVSQTFAVINALVHSHETGVGAKDLTGPIGILSMLATWVKTDYRLALNFMVLLNINLAIINLLPIPVLDGGHIVMSIVEKIRRRPMSVKFMEYVTTAFAVMLISFMLYVAFFDIKRIPLFHAMFNDKVKIEQATPTTQPAQSPPAESATPSQSK